MPRIPWRKLDLYSWIARSEHLTALADQGQYAVVRSAAMVLFARWMSVDAFGSFAVGVAIAFTLQSLLAAAITTPFIVAVGSGDEAEREGARWFGLVLLTSAVLTLALTAGYLLAAHPGATSKWHEALLWSAIMIGPQSVYEFTRRWLYVLNRHRAVLNMSLAFVFVFVAGTAATYVGGHRTWQAVASMSAALAAGSAIAAAALPDLRPALSLKCLGPWREHASISFWQGLSVFPSTVTNQAMNIIVAALGSHVGVAVFATMRNLVSPVTSVTRALESIEKPHASRAFARGGYAGLRRAILRGLYLQLALQGPILVGVALFADEILRLCYGHKYAGYGLELRLASLFFVLQILTHSAQVQLTMMRLSRTIFTSASAGAVATLACAALLIPGYEAAGAFVAVSVGKALSLGLQWRAMRRAYRGAAPAAEVKTGLASSPSA
ncbi:MAG: lipopolysaccharide biosynthesis protein, partial [Rhodospirillaceae bacterium]|nr:lipopolysaccharide biosynthesis protein [Rhodospirillaceae bacterium]